MAILSKRVAPPIGEVAGTEIRLDPPSRPLQLNRPSLGTVRPLRLLQYLKTQTNVRFRVMSVPPMPNVNVEPGGLRVTRDSQNEGMPPTISASRGKTMPVCGGVEAYNERSLHVKYRSQGVQTFTSPPLLHKAPWEIQSHKGLQKIQGMHEQISLML